MHNIVTTFTKLSQPSKFSIDQSLKCQSHSYSHFSFPCSYCPQFLQSVSPGLVRTEFRGRSMKADDMEQAKKDYDTFGVVSIRSVTRST